MGLKLNGSTSGSIELDPQATLGSDRVITLNATGDSTLTLPDANGTLDRLERAGNILQVVSTNWNDKKSYGTADGSGQSLTAGFSVIPSEGYVNITAKGDNSKFYVVWNTNSTSTGDSTLADWIGGYGLVVDPAGGTSWTRIGSGQNSSATNNVKFFSTRAAPSGAAGTNTFWVLQGNGSYLYTSSVSSGTTLRFAVEYFHYDNVEHDTLLINRNENDGTGDHPYYGSFASTISVMEVAA
jgi:hypothetical protein